MNENEVRRIIREEFEEMLASDRYIFHKLVQFLDGRNIQVGLTTGTKIGTSTSQKIGFFNSTPVAQTAPTGIITGFVDSGLGTNITEQDSFTGGTGTEVYTIGDVISKLKLLGILKS